MIWPAGRHEYEDWLQRSLNFATRYVVTGYGLVSARLSGLCEYSDRTSGYVFVFVVIFSFPLKSLVSHSR